MNREDLDACTRGNECPAGEHLVDCPRNPRVLAATERITSGQLCPWGCGIVPPHRHTGFPGDATDCVTYTGAWLAYHYDRSGAAIFPSEVEALRYAVDQGMHVTFWIFGTDLVEATR